MYLSINIALNKPLDYFFISQMSMRVNGQQILQNQVEQNITYELTAKDKNKAYSVLLKHAINQGDFPSDNRKYI